MNGAGVSALDPTAVGTQALPTNLPGVLASPEGRDVVSRQFVGVAVPVVLLGDFEELALDEQLLVSRRRQELAVDSMIVPDRAVGLAGIDCPLDLVPERDGDPAVGFGVQRIRRAVGLANQDDFFVDAGRVDRVIDTHYDISFASHIELVATLIAVAEDFARFAVLHEEVASVRDLRDRGGDQRRTISDKGLNHKSSIVSR